MPQNNLPVKSIDSALVIGAGIMGHGFAQLLSMHNIEVFLVDQSDDLLDRARCWIVDNLDYMIELGKLNASGKESVLSAINLTMGQYAAAGAILASNTSSYDINELAEGLPNPERIIGTHWFHPPQITPCVEVIPSKHADPSNIDLVMEFLTGPGKVPTICKSAPGFVANRIQMALAAEAIALVDEGLATPAEVDRIVKSSFGFRLGAYGPFEIMDQAGADTYLGVYRYLEQKLDKPYFKPPKLLEKQVKAGKLGLKSAGGFYDYGPGAVDTMRRDRDRKFYARLELVRKEWEIE